MSCPSCYFEIVAREIKKHAYQRLRCLDLYPQIEKHLVSGWRLPVLAKWIQSEGQCLDIAARSLERTLLRLRKTLEEEAKERQVRIFEVAELAVAIKDLRHHIRVSMAVEDQIGTLLPGVGNDMLRLAELLTTSVRLKLDLGLYRPTLGRYADG